MVKQLTGLLDGHDIVFKNVGGSTWEVEAPPAENGRYIIALYAEDYAGNISYVATILYTVNVDDLYCDAKLIDYESHTEGGCQYLVSEVKLSGIYTVYPFVKEYAAISELMEVSNAM